MRRPVRQLLAGLSLVTPLILGALPFADAGPR